MSALAHMLEERGVATVAIGAVRSQMERTRPPRGLWTTSQLGRPFGEPEDPGFQRRVLMAALGLLERRDGPVILEDFTEDPPGWQDRPDWRAPALAAADGSPAAPVTLGRGSDGSSAAATDPPDGLSATAAARASHAPSAIGPAGTFGPSPADGLARELAVLMPTWHRAQARFGRTTVGLSRLAPEAWAAFARSALAGQVPTVPGLASPALALRFLCDDIKAFYGEAAQADGPPPSSRQVDTWFWRQTAAGRLLQALRRAAMASEERAVATVGGRFFVPAPWVET